jgi:hypothetical protein
MFKRTRLLFTALCAVIVCSFAAGTASANRSIEIAGGPQVQAEGRLQFIGTEGESAVEITCDITLLRTVTRLIPKIHGTLFGKLTGILIDRGEVNRTQRCRHGSFVREGHDIIPLNCTHSETGNGILRWNCSGAPAGLWKLLYLSFQGTLPRITGISFLIQGTQFQLRLLEPFGGTIECLYEGLSFGLITVNAEGTITRARAVRELTGLTRIRGSFLCPARGSFAGEFNVRPTLTIRLV